MDGIDEGLADESDERALEVGRVSGCSRDQTGDPAGFASCSLQEGLVGVDSVVTLVEARDRRTGRA